MGRRIVVFALAAGLVAAACATDPTVPVPPDTQQGDAAVGALEPIPPAALPGHPAAPVALDAGTVAMDAVQVPELESLLQDAGFVGGTQRQFSRTGAGRRRIDDVIGRAAPNESLTAPADGIVFEHEPNPCCHSETRVFLAMWSHGRTVVTLQVDGPAARASAVPELVSQLDGAV